MNCTGKRCIMQFDKVDPATCKCVSYCPQATPPNTNADRIRAMSDEELAVLLEGCVCPKNPCPDVDRDTQPDKKRCTKCWLDWLRQEAKVMEDENKCPAKGFACSWCPFREWCKQRNKAEEGE